jgi:dihydropteroate synthase/2-amino-4-hydroxy-6-hydroxymethyldihydropteridine diphosphokinase
MPTIYLALGSNLGDRAANIHKGLEALAPFAEVEESSFLYETSPAYVTEQPAFLNAACRAKTDLQPQELLDAVKRTEEELGRVKTFPFGPRSIDLDVLFYDNIVLDTDALTIPHPRLHERDFVLAPLLDLAPNLCHPALDATVAELWQRLNATPPQRVMPVGKRLWRWGERTFVMGILNVTPDSFSGDGLADTSDSIERTIEQIVEQAVYRGQRMAADGADVLDVGGYSTRPGHTPVSVDEEVRRVVPIIRALRDAVDLPLSVDTFRAEVAATALEAGADWINDIWGLRLSPEMGALARRHRTPLVLMHNRTTPTEPDRLAHLQRGYVYADVAADVCRELGEVLSLAQEAGVPRWHRIVDPGIGFGKTPAQHSALIQRLAEVKQLDYPLLFGASRKGFIAKLDRGDVPAADRLPGSLAAAILAVERGADIVRVHDVRESVQALRITDAITRHQRPAL